jgi:hypothetical protein
MLCSTHSEKSAILRNSCDVVFADCNLAEAESLRLEAGWQLQIVFVGNSVSGHHAQVFRAAKGEKLTERVDCGGLIATCCKAPDSHTVEGGDLCGN